MPGPIDPQSDASDAQSLKLKLRLAAAPEAGAYEVSIELSQARVTVQVLDVDLRRAIRRAADRCAAELRDRGYSVTAWEVIGALEEALEHSELVQMGAPSSN